MPSLVSEADVVEENGRSMLWAIHTHNRSSWEAEAGAPEIPGQPGVHMSLRIPETSFKIKKVKIQKERIK